MLNFRRLGCATMDREQRTNFVALAALLHDIGKIAQRAGTHTPPSDLVERFCPQKEGIRERVFQHAAFTAGFIHRNLMNLPPPFDTTSLATVGAGHHDPSSPLQWILAEADSFANARAWSPPEEIATESSLQPLEPVLGRVAQASLGRHFGFRLVEFSLKRDSLFPVENPGIRRSDYEDLYKALCRNVGIVHALLAKQKPRLAVLAATHLLERYCSNVPALLANGARDISIYDHSRTTAAIAACIAFDGLAESDTGFVRDRAALRFALVCIDISGIQRYIHALKSEGARRSITGRSFYVQVLQDAIATAVCDRFSLPYTCVLFQGGGKIWLLLPASVKSDLETWIQELDFQLWSTTGGLLGVACGIMLLSGNDFLENKGAVFWAQVLYDLQKNRLQRMAHLDHLGYEALFGPRPFKRYDCQQCSNETNSAARQCSHCRMTEEIGKRVGRARLVCRLGADDQAVFSEISAFHISLPPALPLRYVFMPAVGNEAPEGAVLLSLRWPSISDVLQDAHKGCVRVFWPVATSPSPDFKGLAACNPGVPVLGVLRADVDNLGTILAEGLERQEQILARFAGLSRLLNIFFGGYVPEEIENKWPNEVRIVFSGGDDCFLLGAFHVMPAVAHWLRQEFGAFCAYNQAMGLSAGIAAQGESAPVLMTARLAANYLAAAKRHNVNGKSKDSVCFLDKTLGWSELSKVGGLVNALAWLLRGLGPAQAGLEFFKRSGPQLGDVRLPRSLLRVLADIDALHRRGKAKNVSGVMISHRWMWLCHYALSRMAQSHGQVGDWLFWLERELLSGTRGDVHSGRPTIELLDIVVTWTHLLARTP